MGRHACSAATQRVGRRAWWLEYRPDCEKESSPCEAIMQATAPSGVLTLPSWVRNTAGPRNPICQQHNHLF